MDWTAITAEAVRHFKTLLRFDTTNPPGNERPAADYLAGVLGEAGIEHRVLESAPTRASLVARLRGNGKKAPLLLTGHLDVVPVDREHWSHDPFAAEEAAGCIWGRGAIDMKNMVAMSLMTVVLLKRMETKLDRDLIFAAVADEEAGSHGGALFLVENHPELVRAEYVLNEVGGHTLHFGDARFYPIQVSEKGICWFELVAHGDPGHGSMPHDNNAVVKLARAIDALGRVKLPQHNTPVVEHFLRELAKRSGFPNDRIIPLLLRPAMSSTLLETLGKKNPDQAMGINAMLRNTVSPTMLAGGSKVNVIPSRASVRVDGRIIPGLTKEDFLREIRRAVGDEVAINVFDHHDGTTFDSKTELYETICKVLAQHDEDAVPVPYMIPGFTDSFAYGRLGGTCYGFSPVKLPKDLNFTRMYHGHDERIPIDGFAWGLKVLFEVVERFCGSQV
jgi:acetylornithine deacetylase/succinyl-diaminopimelate desuccinylase-like protein